MMGIAAAGIRLFAAGLASAGILVASFLLLGPAGPIYQLSGVDLSFLIDTFAWFGLLTLLGALAALAQRRNLGPRMLRLAPRFGNGRRLNELRWPPQAFPAARRLLTDLSWTVLLAGLLGSIPTAAEAISDRPNGLDLANIRPYLEVFGSLSTWTLVFLAPFIAARAASVVWPLVGKAVKFPWVRLLALAFSYVALSEKGAFLEVFDVDGTAILFWLTPTLILSYCGSVLSEAARLAPTRRLKIPALALFFAAEASWVFALLIGLEVLRTAVLGLPRDGFGTTRESLSLHLENLASLTNWAMILLPPFTAARAAGASPA